MHIFRINRDCEFIIVVGGRYSMNKGKFRKIVKTTTILQLTVLAYILSLSGCGKKDNLTLDELAYDQSEKDTIVYLKEGDTFVPYLVLTSDYQGNVLLLRKNLLENTMPYKENENIGWTSEQYGSYYEESSVDQFLNTQFLELLSKTVKSLMVSSSIEITDKESYSDGIRKLHTISRDVFLLSANELDLGVEYIAVAEGEPLQYFEDMDYDKKIACLPDGSECAYWTRTPDLWETYTVLTVGSRAVGSGTADICSGVRPAFCLNRSIELKERKDIVEGKTVYAIE